MTGPVTKLNRIHDAMLQTIMEMTAEELRQSFIDEGEDPDEIVARQRAMIARLIANRTPAVPSPNKTGSRTPMKQETPQPDHPEGSATSEGGGK
jgi:hypothetical protein